MAKGKFWVSVGETLNGIFNPVAHVESAKGLLLGDESTGGKGLIDEAQEIGAASVETLNGMRADVRGDIAALTGLAGGASATSAEQASESAFTGLIIFGAVALIAGVGFYVYKRWK